MQIFTSAVYIPYKQCDAQVALLRNDRFELSSQSHFPADESSVAEKFVDTNREFAKNLDKLNDLTEKLLVSISKTLGKHHGESADIEYWRPMIGPWLSMFVCSNFHKFCLLQVSLNSKYEVTLFNKVIGPVEVPRDTSNFFSLFNCHDYNNKIWALMTKILAPEIKMIDIEPILRKSSPRTSKRKMHFLKSALKALLWRFNSKDIFSEDVFLSVFSRDKQSWPRVYFSIGFPDIELQTKSSIAERKAVFYDQLAWSADWDFETVLNKLFVYQMPSCFLENYSQLKAHCKKFYRKNPRISFATNCYWFHEGFKFWVANLKQDNVPLVISQHGGGYGHANGAFYERHQLCVSDLFLSWGWSYRENCKILPASRMNYPKLKKNPISFEKGSILVMPYTDTKYLGIFYPSPAGSDIYSNYIVVKSFLRLLAPSLQKKVKVRLNQSDNGWGERQLFWGFNISKDNKFVKDCGKAAVLIFNSNTTGWLDGFLLNIPTFLLFEKHSWGDNENTKELFGKLEKMGVLFYSADALADHLNNNYTTVMKWWHSEKNQAGRQEILDEFCSVKSSNTLVTAFEALKV